MKNETGKFIVSKSQYANLIRHFNTVEDFKNKFNKLTYYDAFSTEASEYKRLKVSEHEYKFRVSVQKGLYGTEAKITKDFQSILDYIQKQLKVTAK